jgi:hypothetical protein
MRRAWLFGRAELAHAERETCDVGRHPDWGIGGERMRKIASWIIGLLDSMIDGGIFGAWLLNSSLGGVVWGALASAFTFACFRPWAA